MGCGASKSKKKQGGGAEKNSEKPAASNNNNNSNAESASPDAQVVEVAPGSPVPESPSPNGHRRVEPETETSPRVIAHGSSPKAGPIDTVVAAPTPGRARLEPIGPAGSRRPSPLSPLTTTPQARVQRPSPLSGGSTNSGGDPSPTGNNTGLLAGTPNDAWSRARMRRRSIGGPLTNPLAPLGAIAPGTHPASPASPTSPQEPQIPSPRHRTVEDPSPSPKQSQQGGQGGAFPGSAAQVRLQRLNGVNTYGDIDAIDRPRAGMTPLAPIVR